MKQLNAKQLKSFLKAQKESFELYESDAKKRVEQYQNGLLTFGELGVLLVKLEKEYLELLKDLRKIAESIK